MNGRAPQVAGGSFADIRDNVVYNWGEYAALFKEPNDRINSSATTTGRARCGHELLAERGQAPHRRDRLQLYIEDNVDPVCPTGIEDNWEHGRLDQRTSRSRDRSMRLGAELAHPTTTTWDANTAFPWVLANAGATKARARFDRRARRRDVQNGTG